MEEQIRRKLIVGLFATCFLSLCCVPAYGTDLSKSSVGQLIDELTKIDSQSPGIDSAAVYEGFIADDAPGSFEMGVLGVAAPKVSPQMRELVRRGPLALPELIKHLDDRRPTKFEVGNKDSASSSHQVGVDTFMFSYFSDEYDPRLRMFLSDKAPGGKPRPMEKNFQGRYTVKVGDVCFVIIGQIVNRRLLSVRYQPSGGLVINSPIEVPTLAEKVRNDWGQGNVDRLKLSLLEDIHAKYFPQSNDYEFYRTWTIHSALQRLRLYFPDTYKALEGDDLKKKIEFEKQVGRQQSSNQRR